MLTKDIQDTTEDELLKWAAVGTCTFGPAIVQRLIKELRAERQTVAKLREAGAKVVEGFDKRIFLRNIEADSESGWAIRLAPYLNALATLKEPQ